jgi:Uma2 family endonuclease
MTAKPIVPPPFETTPAGQFPDTPKDDMQNLIHLNGPGFIPAVALHLGSPDTTAVLSEFPIGWNVSQRRGLLSPDLLIAFNVDVAAIIAHNGYSIDYHGKPPDFVLEIASRGTARRDEREKWEGYAAYGVTEYWRFDETDGRFYSVNLAGDRLADGQYEAIPIIEAGHARDRGLSAALNLNLCWEYGHLRWHDPATGYLTTYYQEADRRRAAEAQLAAEREARLALEAELRRLQGS